MSRSDIHVPLSCGLLERRDNFRKNRGCSLMTRILASLIAAWLLVGAASADPSYQFEISIRLGDSDVQRIAIEAPDGQLQLVSFEGDLQVELTSNAGEEGHAALIQLMRSTDLELLHTANLSGLKPGLRRIAYVICGERVRYLSPAPEVLPNCDS